MSLKYDIDNVKILNLPNTFVYSYIAVANTAVVLDAQSIIVISKLHTFLLQP